MKRNSSPFKWRHYEAEIILLCVRWYCRYGLSYRDLAEMMRECGLSVHHPTLFRWVQRYAPQINKRIRSHLKMSGTSYHIDETYVKVGRSWKYLYRSVDKDGQTIEFLLTARRDISSVKRFFQKVMRADHRRFPFSISVGKHASYPDAFAASQKEKVLPEDGRLHHRRPHLRRFPHSEFDEGPPLSRRRTLVRDAGRTAPPHLTRSVEFSHPVLT